MSIHSAKVFVPSSMVTPTGAPWASSLLASLKRVGLSVWRGMEAFGESRAESELRRLAVRYEHQPELAQAFRDAMHRAAMHRDGQH